MPEPIIMKPGMNIMISEPTSTAHFLNPSHQSVCPYAYPSNVARQRLDKNLQRVRMPHATVEELLDA
jgi:hypothetical protein